MYPTLDELAHRLPDTSEVHRFLAKIDVGTVPEHNPALGPCLVWNAARDSGGYATFKSVDSRQVQGHIWLFRKLGGVIPEGCELDHICHEPKLCRLPKRECPHRPCVLHTLAKTRLANMMRSNNFSAINAAKTRCAGKYSPRAADGTIIGHDWSIPGNLYIAPDGSRKCIPCQRERELEWKERQRLLHAGARERGFRDAGFLTLVDL